MPPAVMALIFGGLALVAAWSIRRDFAAGVSGDSMYRFRLDDNPVGFAMMIFGKAFVVVLGGAEILHACGLIGDPFLAMRNALPFMLRGPGSSHDWFMH